MRSEPRSRARGWVDHLRAGGTTPWASWEGSAVRRSGAAGAGFVPGAQQLELLRRLNLSGRPGPHLADRVLTASAPGRGSRDLALVGPSSGPSSGPASGPSSGPDFGARPVDPVELPDDELIRVAAGLVAEDLATVDTPTPHRPKTARLRTALQPNYRLLGDAWTASYIRAQLTASGHPPGGRDPRILVLADDLGTLIAHAWTARCFGEGAPTWVDWLRPFTGSTRVPPRADLVRIAARRNDGVATVVWEPAAMGPLLSGRLSRVAISRPPDPSADAVEAARRVGQPLGVMVCPERRRALLRGPLLDRLTAAPGPPLLLSEEYAEWARARAREMGEELDRIGYPHAGQPRLDDITTTTSAGPCDAGVLDEMLGLLLVPVADDGRVNS